MGATATGARNFLIAYNVNLNTADKSKANAIASKIRTSGIVVKDDNGETVRDKNGIVQRIPGIFEKLQAAGWMYNEEIAQVSMNLLDYSVTGLHDVTEAIKLEASRLGLEAVAGELVGLVPLQAIMDAGNHYSDTNIQDVDSLVENAIEGLMLDRLESFDPYENIIEWAIERGKMNEGYLQILNSISSSKPTPGGGSVAALTLAHGHSLSVMVSTYDGDKWIDGHTVANNIISQSEKNISVA